MESQSEQPYGQDRDIPLAEISQELATEMGIELEVYSEVCVGFLGFDHSQDEQTDITLSASHDNIYIDFDAEGSRGPNPSLPTREAATEFVRNIMTQYRPQR